ncbi:MAG: hypothetical protein H6707_15865 [Deltaproteobacteria bacterium]|nr:hypothetical protein [Deltaproteobacteria bacterium]
MSAYSSRWVVLSLLLSFGLALAGCGRTVVSASKEESARTEICNNLVDDDRDGLIDCSDADCKNASNCQGAEICDNQIDDDGDGLIDCADPQCFGQPLCRNKENCINSIDDDGDGDIDCADADCFGSDFCGGREDCGNGLDDDRDGLIDCSDPDCRGKPECRAVENCVNLRDDDGDGRVDCADDDCAGDPACQRKEDCANGRDDDGDGDIDCDDADCRAAPECKTAVENCTNLRDDDGDFLVDCQDPDCFKHPNCKTLGKEVCNNGVDDDEDTLVDCDDSDCKSLPLCQPGKEICDNGIDDDGDNAVDCADPDCASEPICKVLGCQPTVDFGLLADKGASVNRRLVTNATSDRHDTPCAVKGGGEVVAQFELQADADVKLSYEQISGDHSFSLFRAGIAEACNANPRGCFDPESEAKGEFSLKGLKKGRYFLIAEAFAAGLEGEVSITLSTGSTAQKEQCQNGIDDDGDGAIDCADLDCAGLTVCQTHNCQVDVNLGTLVIDGPSKHANLSTLLGANDDVAEKCGAGGGNDQVVRLALPKAAILTVEVVQSGWHVFGLHQDKGPGTICNADLGSCFDSNGSSGFRLSYGTLEKGVYYFVADALNSASGGTVNVRFSARSNRGPELCANGVDDDGDGLTDCKDPDCVGVIGCPGPVCTPDHRLGTLVPNAPGKRLTVDTRTNNNSQTVSCAQGGGRDVVVELSLSDVSGLAINCSQTGDHVIGLFVAGAPRDPCDKTQTNCADLKTGPLGCNFIFPNLQPGKYYLVAEAFKPGSEGTLDLNIQALPDHAQEICDNGIDDDGDGQIDCKDSNCSSNPICASQTCTPDQKLGTLPIGGSPTTVATTTKGAGDQQTTSCGGSGGEDAVIGFTLPGPADLTVDFAQFGEHVLALFEDRGQGFGCDAAPVSCQSSGGQATGQVSFGQLKAGAYFLVIDAKAGQEGSAVLQINTK